MVVGNYRQLGAPLLFPRTVSVYLLAGFIDIFPFWTLFLLLFFHFILQREKKKKPLLHLEVMFPFLVVMEMKRQIIKPL